MARLYANENFPEPAVVRLRELGHDVLTMQEHGRAGLGLPDEEVLRIAAADDRAVLTHNRRHFIALDRDNPDHAGMIVCSCDNDAVALAERIHLGIMAAAELSRQVVRVNRPLR